MTVMQITRKLKGFSTEKARNERRLMSDLIERQKETIQGMFDKYSKMSKELMDMKSKNKYIEEMNTSTVTELTMRINELELNEERNCLQMAELQIEYNEVKKENIALMENINNLAAQEREIIYINPPSKRTRTYSTESEEASSSNAGNLYYNPSGNVYDELAGNDGTMLKNKKKYNLRRMKRTDSTMRILWQMKS